MGIVSLKYDFSFKHLMSNEEVRKYFISDVLEIPVEKIKSVRLSSPFLWKRFFWQKEGILDILLTLNDDSKVNIELQIKVVKHWDKRILFYLAKMFTEDLVVGEKYTKLKKCISISILDFNIDNSPEYHRVYKLRDKKGNDFSDLFEVHIIELRKKLEGSGRMDDWIRLFNAKTEEEIDMIRTDNPGILEAIREVKTMGLGRTLRALYEMRMKEIRDRNARDDYVRDEGIAIGEARGMRRGELAKLVSLVRKKAAKNVSAEEIASILEEDIVLVTNIYNTIQVHPKWNDEKISRELDIVEDEKAEP